MSKHSWFKEGDLLKAGSKGRRLIVLHALTRAGWVRAKNDDGSYVKLTEAEGKDLQTDRLTAELIFEAKKADGDYHDSMDSETFIKWVKHRLLLTQSPNLQTAFFDIEVHFDPERGYSKTEDLFNPITAISVYLDCMYKMVTVTMVVPPKSL